MFHANLTGPADLWWGVGLGARETDSTYQEFSYSKLPPLPVERFDGSFRWLEHAPRSDTHSDEQANTGWDRRIADLRRRGFNVPRAFETLMLDVGLQLRVPSCTDNTFLSGVDAELHPLFEKSECFLTFYTDSQSCVVWGIRLAKGDDRYAPVLAGAPEFPDEDPPEGQPYFSFPELTFCAPTFESFLYRWWLENTLWFAANSKKRPLNPEEQAYMDRLAGNS